MTRLETIKMTGFSDELEKTAGAGQWIGRAASKAKNFFTGRAKGAAGVVGAVDDAADAASGSSWFKGKAKDSISNANSSKKAKSLLGDLGSTVALAGAMTGGVSLWNGLKNGGGPSNEGYAKLVQQRAGMGLDRPSAPTPSENRRIAADARYAEAGRKKPITDTNTTGVKSANKALNKSYQGPGKNGSMYDYVSKAATKPVATVKSKGIKSE